MTAIEGQVAWDALVKKPKEINPLFMEEILFQLEELILWNGHDWAQRIPVTLSVNSPLHGRPEPRDQKMANSN